MNREEFEKLPEIAEILKSGDIFFNDVLGVYGSKTGDDLAAGFVSGAWYAWQEQQKKIDKTKEKLNNIYDACDENITVAILLDEIEELLK